MQFAGMTIERLDHTGDLGVIGSADSLEELFTEFAQMMFVILAEAGDPAPIAEETFAVVGQDPPNELREFLAELLYRFSAERKMYVRFRPGRGSVTCFWESYDASRHPLRTEIKAVTYHQLEARRDGDRWRAQVIFDI
jgi:SHS2 domain-containing protein